MDYNNITNEVEKNDQKIERLENQIKSNKIMVEGIALCTLGSLAFTSAILTLGDSNIVSSGCTFVGVSSLIGICGLISSKVDKENEIYYLRQKNKVLKDNHTNNLLNKYGDFTLM